MKKEDIEKLKLYEMKPPLFAEEIIDKLERDVMNDKWEGRNPKWDGAAEMRIKRLNRIKRQVFINNLCNWAEKNSIWR